MDPQLSPHQGASVSGNVVDILKRTRGWVLFFSVLLWIGVGFLLLGGVALIGVALVGGAMGEQIGQAMGMQEVGMIVAMGAFYLVFSLLYIYPALKLGKYASRISDLARQPNQAALAAALDEQRAFWKFVGVLTLLIVVLYFAIIVIAIVAGLIGGVAAASAGG